MPKTMKVLFQGDNGDFIDRAGQVWVPQVGDETVAVRGAVEGPPASEETVLSQGTILALFGLLSGSLGLVGGWMHSTEMLGGASGLMLLGNIIALARRP